MEEALREGGGGRRRGGRGVSEMHQKNAKPFFKYWLKDVNLDGVP